MVIDELGLLITTAKLAVLGIGPNYGVKNSLYFSGGNFVPPGDGPFLVLLDYPGTEAMTTQNGLPMEQPNVQVSVRGTLRADCRALLTQVYNLFGGAGGRYNFKINNVFYMRLKAKQPPFFIGLDDKNRPMDAFNLGIVKQAS